MQSSQENIEYSSEGSATPSLTEFFETSGINDYIMEAMKALYVIPNKPENPIEWLRLYFKDQQAGGLPEDEDMEDDEEESEEENNNGNATDYQAIEEGLQIELAEIEAKLLNAFEVEAQNKAIILRLEHELKNMKHSPAAASEFQPHHRHEDFRVYQYHPEDYHYRIRPSPSYQPSTSDMLVSDDEMSVVSKKGGSAGLPHLGTVKEDDEKDGIAEQRIYADYQTIYFPNSNMKRFNWYSAEDEYDFDVSEGTEEEEDDKDKSESLGGYVAGLTDINDNNE